jgi:hypothetical protein
MPDDPIFGKAQPSFLARLARLLFSRRASLGSPRSVQRREQLDVLVPSDKAEAVRVAVERWLGESGVTPDITIEDAGNNRSRIRAKLSAAESSKVDLSADAVQSALENVLVDAV